MLAKKKLNKKSFTRRIFSFKHFILAGILVIVFLGSMFGKEYYREYKIKEEIDLLKKEIDSLEKDNYKLSQFIEYYQTDEYKELEIRKRFNMKKEGEKVAVIKPVGDVLGSFSAEQENNTENNLPNYIKWWNYFFASRE